MTSTTSPPMQCKTYGHHVQFTAVTSVLQHFFFMFFIQGSHGTVSYLDIFVLIDWWFANIWLLHIIFTHYPSLTSLHGVNSKLVPRKFQLRAVTMLPSG